jgi:hypothetical protein
MCMQQFKAQFNVLLVLTVEMWFISEHNTLWVLSGVASSSCAMQTTHIQKEKYAGTQVVLETCDHFSHIPNAVVMVLVHFW